jgi:nucleoside-diphosphate-sugar epimerase
MDNFLLPKVPILYMGLEHGKIPVVFRADKKLQFIDVADTGAFARAAFDDPERFRGRAIDLAGDELTIGEIARELALVTGKSIDVEHVTEKEAVARGMDAMLANYQEWTNAAGYTVDIAALRSWGIPLTTFGTFFARNRDALLRYLR